MIYTVKEFTDKFLVQIGDTSLERPLEFVIQATNWAFNELPRVPKLDRIFSHHYTRNLDAKGHYKFNLNEDFRRITDIPVMNFFTSDGGEPCPLKLCNKDMIEFYEINGIPELKKKGIPCQYTIEQEGDDIYLVFDRPLDTPVIVDYICYGYPKPVKDENDTIEISAIAENLMIGLMKAVFFWEGDDFNFAQSILEYIDNKAMAEAIQQLNARWGVEEHIILGER